MVLVTALAFSYTRMTWGDHRKTHFTYPPIISVVKDMIFTVKVNAFFLSIILHSALLTNKVVLMGHC